jgi:hypothetical protein
MGPEQLIAAALPQRMPALRIILRPYRRIQLTDHPPPAGELQLGAHRVTAATAAVIARSSGLTAAPATGTVGVPLTPRAVARAVTYGGQSR